MRRNVAQPLPSSGTACPVGEILGTSPAIRQVLSLIRRMAPAEGNVLIEGETGTGKELIARALHAGSPRARMPLVTVNCAVIQETLLASELFGHVKGAFTSADSDKPGLFELADGGTLFIDEIGEMKVDLQAKLLRVLEDGRVRRVGDTKWIPMRVRVITATNRDLAKEVAESRFRKDLYYRLKVLTIKVPPLRERRQDIPLLVRHFLSLDPGGPQEIELGALKALLVYDWPGNVRELQNAIRQAKVLAEGPIITVHDLPEDVVCRPAAKTFSSQRPPGEPQEGSLDDLEGQHVRRALESQGWNKSQAARKLGISRQRLYRLMEKHGLGK